MDHESGHQQLLTVLRKYQYVILIVVIGAFLMVMPSSKENVETAIPTQEPAEDLETELAMILSHISGAGKTEVLLTEASGSNTIYQMDTGQNQSNLDTVVVMDSNRDETGLVKQVLPPEYKGAVILCQGADHAVVRLSVVEAVKSVTGLSADRITVLKMK